METDYGLMLPMVTMVQQFIIREEITRSGAGTTHADDSDADSDDSGTNIGDGGAIQVQVNDQSTYQTKLVENSLDLKPWVKT